MALHIKIFEAHLDGTTYSAVLQYAKTTEGYGVVARLFVKTPRGREAFVGIAGVNKAGELVRRPEAVSQKAAEALEAAIAAGVG